MVLDYSTGYCELIYFCGHEHVHEFVDFQIIFKKY